MATVAQYKAIFLQLHFCFVPRVSPKAGRSVPGHYRLRHVSKPQIGLGAGRFWARIWGNKMSIELHARSGLGFGPGPRGDEYGGGGAERSPSPMHHRERESRGYDRSRSPPARSNVYDR